MPTFKDRVIDIISKIPYGKVVSYGQVALYAGSPRAARQVGWILHSTEDNVQLPWWRVINSSGRISIKGSQFYTPLDQKKLLESEGIVVSDHFELAIESYRFVPNNDL